MATTETLVFTRSGFERHQDRLQDAYARVQAAGKEVGQEAGLACDWHDNFGFEEARRRLEDLSELARKLANELSRARVVDPVEQDEIVAVGTTVSIEVNGEEQTYLVGGYGETDLALGVVSYDAPLMRSLLGAHVDDERRIQIGGQTLSVYVVAIQPPSASRSHLRTGGDHG